ncbi:Chymotrypsin-like elastase family member 2A [Seminavis robusta]|uniref:Chymotrypsin-like elastase family member 2A n=1 Tax=Seminavis robusta TaxID=568900 RepID=A0A9N8H180_9STRA|nr:Chymotrypsin-like elastase family member 2A [Seminavis robusta]|eukprot:Sro12_g009500.1 Chymotrypsin-like elastase family member 2A (579) ;mRNA; f:136756-138492
MVSNAKALVGLLTLAATFEGAFPQTFGDGPSLSRIVGGKDADPEKYPFYVSLEQGCAGALVAPDVVVSSSHCVADGHGINMNVTVKAYESNFSETRSIVGLSRHPQYLENSLGYDVAILLLNDIVEGAVPVEINVNGSLPIAGDNLTVIGFPSITITTIGADDNETFVQEYEVLQEGKLVAYADSACVDAYGDIWQGNQTMLCAGNEEGGSVHNCADDRGGPLLDEDNMMVGIVSLGSTCGKKDSPGIYMRASAFSEWIDYQVCTMSSVPPSYCDALLEYYFPPNSNSNNSIVVSLPPSPPENSTNVNNTILVTVPDSPPEDPVPGEPAVEIDVNEGVDVDAVPAEPAEPATGSDASAGVDVGDVPREPPAESDASAGADVDAVPAEPAAGSDASAGANVEAGMDGNPEADNTGSSGPDWGSTGGVTVTIGGTYAAPSATPPPALPQEQAVSLKLEIHYDAYGIENAWTLRNMDVDEIIDEKKYYTVAPAGLSSTVYKNLLAGNYTFTIQDYANDGICCNFGEGFVRLTQVYDDDVVDIDNKEIWHLKGNFEAQAAVEFQLYPYTALPETAVDVTKTP